MNMMFGVFAVLLRRIAFAAVLGRLGAVLADWSARSRSHRPPADIGAPRDAPDETDRERR